MSEIQIIEKPGTSTTNLIKGLQHLAGQSQALSVGDSDTGVLKGGKKKIYLGTKIGGKKKTCQVSADSMTDAAALCLWKLFPNSGKHHFIYQVYQKGGKLCACKRYQGERKRKGKKYKYTFQELR